MRDFKGIILLLLIVCIIIMSLTIVASADHNIKIGARSAALYIPNTGDFIYSKEMNTRLPMASTTKIMTGLLAVELSNLDERVEVPKDAVGVEGSSVYLTEGDVLTMRDLVYSLLLQSANDAAVAIAYKISGDISSFARLMNERAEELGLLDTHFDNPHGLDSEGHYTTAHDLAILAGRALENTSFRRVVSTYKYSFKIGDKTRTVVNHNKLLKSYDGCIGVKTGYTKRCGRCLVSAAERDGVTLVAVTLNAPDDWRDHTNMLNYGFENYERVRLRDITDTSFTVPVIGADKEKIKAKISDTASLPLIRRCGEGVFSTELNINEAVNAPVKEGDKLGEIIFKKDGNIIAKRDIVASESAEKARKRKFNIFDIFNN